MVWFPVVEFNDDEDPEIDWGQDYYVPDNQT